jgi:hypothetical protein
MRHIRFLLLALVVACIGVLPIIVYAQDVYLPLITSSPSVRQLDLPPAGAPPPEFFLPHEESEVVVLPGMPTPTPTPSAWGTPRPGIGATPQADNELRIVFDMYPEEPLDGKLLLVFREEGKYIGYLFPARMDKEINEFVEKKTDAYLEAVVEPATIQEILRLGDEIGPVEGRLIDKIVPINAPEP